jgi:oligopeptide transport system ATP-binding protein
VNGISFDLFAGETLGVVGESGCGKSTLARALLNLNPANSGSIRWMGQEMQGATEAAWLSVRKDIQMIFQDPLASLDPRMTVAQIIAEPLRTHHPELSHDEVMARYAPSWVGLGSRRSRSTATRMSSRAGNASASALRVR